MKENKNMEELTVPIQRDYKEAWRLKAVHEHRLVPGADFSFFAIKDNKTIRDIWLRTIH